MYLAFTFTCCVQVILCWKNARTAFITLVKAGQLPGLGRNKNYESFQIISSDMRDHSCTRSKGSVTACTAGQLRAGGESHMYASFELH